MIALLLLLPFLAFSETHFAVLGGGGEPARAWTIFDEGFKAMGEFSKKNPDIKTTMSFNGGHEKTEAIAKENFGITNPFTREEYLRIVNGYVAKIGSGEIKPGDKLLLNIYTHGAEKTPLDKSHMIAASGEMRDFNKGTGSSLVSMDNLKILADLAEEKGVNLAIVDLSCHSGNSLALANSKTCVISATGPNHYSGAGSKSFGTLLSKSLEKGKNLEEIFLKAREDFVDPSFPMISSPQGKEAQGKIYDAMTPYLYYFNPSHDKFITFMENSALEKNSCSLDAGFADLLKEIDGMLKTVGKSAELENFRSSVIEYHSFIKNLKRQMDEFGIGDMGQKHQFCSGGECVTLSMKELFATNHDYNVKYYEESLRSSRSSSERADYARKLEIAKKVRAKATELKQAGGNYTKASEFWAKFPDLTRQTSILQSKVSASQKKFYLEMYKHSSAQGPNPCREFKL